MSWYHIKYKNRVLSRYKFQKLIKSQNNVKCDEKICEIKIMKIANHYLRALPVK